MTALLRVLIRGVLLGGLLALLWRALGTKSGRMAASGFVVERAKIVPFVGARLYAAAEAPLMGDIYRAVAEEVTSEARSGEIMELGTGTGLLAVELGKRARDLEVTTAEESPYFVQLAESRIHNSGLGRQVKVALAEDGEIPFVDGSYDYVVSFGKLHQWGDPDGMLAEIHRLLKPGGKAWIYDFRSDMTEEGWDLVRDRIDPVMRPLFDGVIVSPWRAALTEGQIRSLVAASPFVQAEVGVLTADIAGAPVPAITRVVLSKPVE
jgi:ubiquinone/menaquinone biosynthesis C-methylase UbiE